MTTFDDLNKSIERLGETALRIADERNEALKACRLARPIIADLARSLENSEVLAVLDAAIAKAEGAIQ